MTHTEAQARALARRMLEERGLMPDDHAVAELVASFAFAADSHAAVYRAGNRLDKVRKRKVPA